jgi:hypothetical protein
VTILQIPYCGGVRSGIISASIRDQDKSAREISSHDADINNINSRIEAQCDVSPITIAGARAVIVRGLELNEITIIDLKYAFAPFSVLVTEFRLPIA